MMNFIDTGQDKATVGYFQKALKDDTYGEITLKIKGDKRHLSEIERMIGYMERLGQVGHSTSFQVNVDGDGAFTIHTKDAYGEKLSKKCLDSITNPEGTDIKSFTFD